MTCIAKSNAQKATTGELKVGTFERHKPTARFNKQLNIIEKIQSNKDTQILGLFLNFGSAQIGHRNF